MVMLEERIKILSEKHEQVWYMADGIYSMYGDGLPAEDLERLLNKYKNFRLYVDDAHGMSWAGKNGRGYTLSKMDLHPQMVVATSFAKGFGAGGGVLVFPHQKQAQLIRTCGGPLVTSGPLQPATLGAGIEIAKLHFTPKFKELQQDLIDNINYCNLMLKNSNLPAVFNSETPIFFIGTSLPKIAYKVIRRMINEGFYLNLGIFPAVPMRNTGVRFTITRLHTFDQIEAMVNTLEKHYFDVLKEENFDITRINEAFGIESTQEINSNNIISTLEGSFNLNTEHYNSIKDIKKEEWDTYFSNKGNFDWNGLHVLEESFYNNTKKENNWDFDYIIIKNNKGEVILATFFTTALNKDDMFAPENISFEIEKERVKTPYYLTSKTLFMGSLFSEGEHLYLDYNSQYWKNAMSILFEKINEIKNKRKAENIVLRDFTNINNELNSFFIDNGYYQSKMPNNFVIEDLNWKNEDDFLRRLSAKGRRNVRNETLKNISKFDVTIYDEEQNVSSKKLDQWYKLYLNVKNKSLKLNTFTLPFSVFSKMIHNNKLETIELSNKNNNEILAVIFCYKNNSTYNPMLIGLRYDINQNMRPYSQALYQIVTRANEIGSKTVNLGFSADTEKKKIGAKLVKTYAFVSTDETYSQTIMSNMNMKSSKNELILN